VNVKTGIVLAPLDYSSLRSSYGGDRDLDFTGWDSPERGSRDRVGLVRRKSQGWTSTGIVRCPDRSGACSIAELSLGAARVLAMLPMHSSATGSSTLTNSSRPY